MEKLPFTVGFSVRLKLLVNMEKKLPALSDAKEERVRK